MYKDNEIKGIGNSLDFGARLYDSRVGRWLSIDPMAALQPSQSTYKAFLNNPIIMADPDGKKEYITTINYDERTGNTTVKIHTGNTIMTDGVKHRIWDNSVDYHWENNYYDYSTVIYQTTNKSGKTLETFKTSTILKDKGVKDRDNVWFGGNKNGDWKIESWSKVFDIKEYVGGIMIYGSDRDGSLSPGDKKFNGKILGSFDFGGFMDIFNLATAGITNPTITDTKFDGESLANIVNNAKDAAEQLQKEEREKKQKSKDVVCPACKNNTDSTHIDDVNGKGTYEKQKQESSN